MIRTVREVLCLHSHAAVVIIDAPVLSYRATCKVITCVNLDRRLCGVDLEISSAHHRVELGGLVELSFLEVVENPARVVSLSVIECREILVDILSDSFGFAEIHRCAGNRIDRSCRDKSFVCRKVS